MIKRFFPRKEKHFKYLKNHLNWKKNVVTKKGNIFPEDDVTSSYIDIFFSIYIFIFPLISTKLKTIIYTYFFPSITRRVNKEGEKIKSILCIYNV